MLKRAGRTTRIATSIAALAALMAATALAVTPPQGTFKGSGQKNYDKNQVTVKTNASGRVTLVKIGWRAKCEKPGKFWFGGTNFKRKEGLAQDGDTFHDAGKYSSPTSDGNFTGVISVKVKGSFPDTSHVEGTFRAAVKVKNKQGNQIDSCALKTAWHAKR